MQEHNNTPNVSSQEQSKFTPKFDLFLIEKAANELQPQDFINDAEHLLKQGNEAKEAKGLFTVKTASSWIEQAKTRPIPKMLFSEFWFEGELCILFADTNLGKSILAVQIGNSISRGEQIRGFKLETPKQPILYFDFELSDKQFENRYD